MLVDMTTLAPAIPINLVDANLGVPTRDGEIVGAVGRRRESQVGDAVGGRLVECDISLEVADGGARRRARRAAKECRHGCRGSWVSSKDGVDFSASSARKDLACQMVVAIASVPDVAISVPYLESLDRLRSK